VKPVKITKNCDYSVGERGDAVGCINLVSYLIQSEAMRVTCS